jgi:hypothetical protein
MDNLQAVVVGQIRRFPLRSRYDIAIQFYRYAIQLQSHARNQRCERKWPFKALLFPIDLEFHRENHSPKGKPLTQAALKLKTDD